MTLILALACKDGVVVAADSQATFTGSTPQVRVPEQKLWQIRDAPVVFGVSGQVGMAQKVKAELERIHFNVLAGPIAQSRPIFKNFVFKVLKDAAEHFVWIDQTGGKPVCNTVIAGYTGDTPWILEINCNGLDEQHEHRGFLALGSGEAFAHFACASMQHHAVRQMGMRAAQVLAYRTIATAIEVAGEGLGLPVQMWVIDSNGARALDEGELEIISDTVDTWKELETEFLAQAMLPQDECSGAQE